MISAHSLDARSRQRTSSVFSPRNIASLFLATFFLLALNRSILCRAADEKEKSSAPLPKKPLIAAPGKVPQVFDKLVPGSLEELRTFEKHITALVAKISPAVVGLEVGFASGSGVIISEDGLIMTVAHVAGAPGRKVEVIFPDGKRVQGVTLGTNHEMDSGLMQITTKGKWPHVPVGELDTARLGDWVLALGHPGGFDKQRSLVVRLGRIIRAGSDMVQTDCILSGGDSGGPLFDMSGRVVGIHSRISEDSSDNFHVAINNYFDAWDRLAKGDNWGADGGRAPASVTVGVSVEESPDGCVVVRVREDGPGGSAGLKVGDVIVRIAGHEVTDRLSYRRMVLAGRAGEEMKFDVRRGDKELTLVVKPQSVPAGGRGRGFRGRGNDNNNGDSNNRN